MVVVCIMASVCWGQSYWKRTYGGTGFEYGGTGVDYDYAYAITPTPDGNFIVAGGNSRVVLLKITPNGDTLWKRNYSSGVTGFDDDFAYAITPTPDGNFIVAGNTTSFGAGIYDVYLLKINSNGDTLWTKTYGGTSYLGVIAGENRAYAITPTSDGNFIVAGNTTSFRTGIYDVYFLKINLNGDALWTKTYYGDWGARVITPTPDGNFIVVCNNGNVDGKVYLLKITPDGDTLWSKRIGLINLQFVNAITPTPDGNFIVTGNSFSPTALYFLKITQNGDLLWTKTYGRTGSDGAEYAIAPTSDGNFIVTGFSDADIYIFKIKPNGDTLWTKTYKCTDTAFTIAVTSTPDGNFIVAEYRESSGGYIWLFSIIDDRYAKKDSLFTFKIPVSGDSLSHGYAPLKAPSGMIVSPGGTISWTPQTDSVYMDHAEFLVSDDFGKKDTLTFNIFVNSSNKPTAIKTLSRPILNKNQFFSIMQTSSSQIKFTLPSGASSLDIYDIHGRCVQRVKPMGAQAIWNGLSTTGSPVSSGRYFAKIKEGKTSRMGQFTVVR